MEIRPATKSDYPSIAPVVSAALGETYSPSDLMDTIFFDEDFDPNLVLVSREKGETLALAVSVLKGEGDDRVGYLKLMAVHPNRQRQGLGKDMLARLEERLADDGAKRLVVGPCPPYQFFLGVKERYSGAVAFFEKMGYSRGPGEIQAWVPAVEGGTADGFEAKPEDFKRVMAWLRVHHPAWKGRLEEAFSFAEPQVALSPASGPIAFCFFEPGQSLGPLFADSAIKEPPVALLKAAIRAACREAPADPRGIQVLDACPLDWWKQALPLKDLEACLVFDKKLRD
jgi:ribosomal protein S18 acetylase RimI-like enzyme